jgi:beta-lactamase class A
MDRCPNPKQKGVVSWQAGFAPIVHLLIGALVGIIIVALFFNFRSGGISNLPAPSPQNSNNAISSQPKVATQSAQLNTVELYKYLTVEAALLGISNNYSLYLHDLKSDQEVTVDPTRSWIPTSTIKAYVLLEAFRQRDLGLISFDKTITIDASNVVPTELETLDFPRLRAGTQATVKQLLGAMITQSDNTAYNTMLDLLDRRNINKSLRNIGLTETVVGEKLNLDDGQFQQDLTVAGRQPNTTTAKDLATFFELLSVKQIPDSDEMLSIFKAQKINNMIPALLPNGVEVAHKTGDWAPIYHDGGVIYKPDQPFVLAIYTNANEPSALSQLAKVAYFDSAEVVGQDIVEEKKVSQSYPNYYLSENNFSQAVLAAETETDRKFPEVTAEDLGITPSDLSLLGGQNAQKVSSAFITPGSLAYSIKRGLENLRFSLSDFSSHHTDKDIAASSSRLSELKTTLKNGDLDSSRKLLDESEQNLKDAVDKSKKGQNSSADLTNIQEVNDLHFATLAQEAKSVDPKDKQKFVDMVYDFIQKNNKEVEPTLEKSVITNPLQQKPIIGTVKEIKDNQATIEFDDGNQKSMNLTNLTPVRDFHSDQIDKDNQLIVGSKLAIVGQTTEDNKIIPRFVLKNIPHELPDKHEGVVLEVDPNDKILKIKENDQTRTIEVDQKTVLKGSDTDVSLEGIKAGSKVTIFGEYQATPSATPLGNQNQASSSSQVSSSSLPQPKASGTSGLSGKTTPTTSPNTKPAPTTAPNSGSNPPPIKATTISVTKNSSGAQETSKSNNPPPKPVTPPKK